MKRRAALFGLSALFTGACSKIADSRTGQSLFDLAEGWHRKAHRALADREALAPEYSKADISPVFKGNGSVTVESDIYADQLARGFPDWRLQVRGMVKNPLSLSLDSLRVARPTAVPAFGSRRGAARGKFHSLLLRGYSVR